MKTPKGSLYSRHEAYRLLADNNIKTTKLRVYIIFKKRIQLIIIIIIIIIIIHL